MFDMPNDDRLTMARSSGSPCEFYVRVSPRFLRHDISAELARDFAHELGHVINRDWTPEHAPVSQIDRERQADAQAIKILNRLGAADCRAQIQHFQKIRAENIRAWGAEQRDTIHTHPSYTERIRTFEAGCRQS